MKKLLNVLEILILAFIIILLYYTFIFPDPSLSMIFRFPYANDTIRLIVDILLVLIFIIRIVLLIRSFLKQWAAMKRLNTFERIFYFLGIMFLSFDIISFKK